MCARLKLLPMDRKSVCIKYRELIHGSSLQWMVARDHSAAMLRRANQAHFGFKLLGAATMKTRNWSPSPPNIRLTLE